MAILTRGVGTKMVLTFRLFLVAAGLVILALAVTARGLVPEPEVRTRIGEVPSVGRSLVQQAIVPPAMIERLSVGPESKRAEEPAGTSEPSDSAIALAASPRDSAHAPPGTEQTPDRGATGPAQAALPEPLAAKPAETPEPETAKAALAEQARDRTATAPPEPSPGAASVAAPLLLWRRRSHALRSSCGAHVG
jgi:hypothetical protein